MKNNCKHCGNCKCKDRSITDIKTICQMALGHTYGFTADISDIKVLETNWDNYHIIDINNKRYRVKNLYAQRVKVVASYGY